MKSKAFRSLERGRAPRPTPRPQPDQARGAVAPAANFPSLTFEEGRTLLFVHEVARRLRVTEQHVVNLIEEGRLRALDIAGVNPRGRRHFRIPIEAWQAYVRANLY